MLVVEQVRLGGASRASDARHFAPLMRFEHALALELSPVVPHAGDLR